MISSFFLAPLIALVLAAWVALLDAKLKNFWGEKYSFSKALLLLLSLLSGLYQIAFIFHLTWFFPLINVVGVVICGIFYRAIFGQFKQYAVRLKNHRTLYPLYPFLVYRSFRYPDGIGIA